ncbi:hypothetical protein CF326_g2006 [Tilletia indica]|nr:hypothetical protein CF326_g2006 [Tilletia indica]
MLALILTTLILAFISLLSSFAVLLRTFLPIVLASKATDPSRRRGAYGANLRTTSVNPQASSVASLSNRRASEGRSDTGQSPWQGTSSSEWSREARGSTRLRSAQRVQVWLAIFDIVSIAFLLAYWIIIATTPHPSWTSFPASPFTDSRSAALLIIALSLRPTLLTLVSAIAFSHIRLGRSSYLGKLDWGLWASTIAFTVSISGMAGLLFRYAPQRIASKVLTGSLLGINVLLLLAGTGTLFGLMWTIYQAKTAFRISILAGNNYRGMEDAGRSSPTIANVQSIPSTKAHPEYCANDPELAPPIHQVASDRGTFGQRNTGEISEVPNDFNEPVQPPHTGDVNLLMGTVTTTTGGAMSAVAGSAVPSSADPYHLAPTVPSTQKDTISTARSLGTAAFRGGSFGSGGRTGLAPTPERGNGTQPSHRRGGLGSSTSITSETHAFLDANVNGNRTTRISGESRPSDSSEISGLPYRRGNESRKSLKEVLENIGRSNQGCVVNDWRHSLSQIRIAPSESSDEDAVTLHQPSPRPSLQQGEVLVGSGLPPSPLSPNIYISPDRIRQEAEDQVDRMFAEVGLRKIINDKWRQIIPTGSLPIVRSPNQSHQDTTAEISRAWQRASTYAPIQTAAFSTKPLMLVPATPRADLNVIPHTYDPNFDGTFSQSARSAQMADHSSYDRSPSNFSTTGIRCVRMDESGQRPKESSPANPSFLQSSSAQLSSTRARIGTFGEEKFSDLHHAVDFSNDLPVHTTGAGPQQPSSLHNLFASPTQSQHGRDHSLKLRPPFFDPGFLAPTANQLGFVNVPASRTLPSLRGSPITAGHDSIPPSDAASELVQAVQGGGDDMVGAQSALVRIASCATLRAAVHRVEFDLTGEEDRLQQVARTGSRESVDQHAAAVAQQNYNLHMLKQAQWQEELLSNRETKIAFLRLSGHLLGLWIPFIFSLPYLVFSLANPRASSAPFTLPLLLSLSVILGGPLSLIQTFLTYGTGLSFLASLANTGDPLLANSSQHSSRRTTPLNSYRDLKSSDRTLLDSAGSRRKTDDHLDNFAVRIETAASAGMNDQVRSVRYRREHWNAGEVVGDRVARPRSALLRGISLLFDPRPRLEVLPFRAEPEVDTGSQRLRPDAQPRNGPNGRPSTQDSVEELNLGRTRDGEQAPHTRPSQDRSGRPSTNARSRNGTSQTNSTAFQLDGLSAMLLPRLVPGLSIGPDVQVADDDERTLVEEYQNFYRRYLSDLPDIFNFNSAREAFQGARRTIMSRLSIRQNLAPTTVAWNMRATDSSVANATFGDNSVPGDDSMYSFTTAAEASEVDGQQTPSEQVRGVGTPVGTVQEPSSSAPRSNTSAESGTTVDGSKVFSWVPQQAEVSPSRRPAGRSSSVSVEAGRSFGSLQNVTTRSRPGKHRRDAASLPDAKPETLAEASEDIALHQLTPSKSDPVGVHQVVVRQVEPTTVEKNKQRQSTSPTPPEDTSLSLSVGVGRGMEDSHRRSLASELGMASTRKSLGSEMGLESVGSGRQRKSLSSDFGLLLAALREQKEGSPSSSKRLTSDSMSSTIMSEEISLSSPSRHEMTPRNNSMRMQSSPPLGPSPAPNAVADTTSSISVDDEAAEAPATLADEMVEAPLVADQIDQHGPSDEEIAQAIRQMDPLTLHRYLHPAMPLETLDEVTEEMTADLTRSLDAIWVRSQRDSFMSLRNSAVIGTPVKQALQDDRSSLGFDTPLSVIGRYGWAAVISRKGANQEPDLAANIAPSTTLKMGSTLNVSQIGLAAESRSDVSAFDNSVWNSLAVAPLSFTVASEKAESQRTRTTSGASVSTIGFEREAEWIDNPSPKARASKGKSKERKQHSHSQRSDLTVMKRTSFNSSSGSSSRSSTISSASGVKAAGVPESPWAVVSARGDVDLTILSPPPTMPTPSGGETAEKWGSLVNQRISRFETLGASQETPCKAVASRGRNNTDRHRFALQDKTNCQPSNNPTELLANEKWSCPSSARQSPASAAGSSPSKRSSFPPAHHDGDASEANNSQTASLGRKSIRASSTIPAIHVRAPSDSSALSFYHF